MIADPLRDLAFGYAPSDRRAALAALFALDAALGQVLRTTREPMVGQMRLAWWREALERLDTAPAPGEPVLQGLAADVMPLGVRGEDLARMVKGWEPLLGEIDTRAIDDHARFRGAQLFGLAGRVLGASQEDPLDDAGRGWALADLSHNLGDRALAASVRGSAAPMLEAASRARWSRAGRALGALVLIARRDDSETAAKGLVFRLGWHRLTGR